jgi:hypothetical protein
VRSYRRDQGSGWLILACVIFGLTLLIGFFIGKNGPSFLDPLLKDTPTQEYVILVAYMYDREGVLLSARDRLSKLGDKGSDKAIASLVVTYPKNNPEYTREAQSLGRLAKDLEVSGLATSGSESSGGGLPWGVWIVLFLLVAGLIFVFAYSLFGNRIREYIPGFKSRPASATRRRIIPGQRQRYDGSPESTPFDAESIETSLEDEEEEEPGPLAQRFAAIMQYPRRLLSPWLGSDFGGGRSDRRVVSGVPLGVQEVDVYGDDNEGPEWVDDTPADSGPLSHSDSGRLLQSIQSSYVSGQDVYQEVFPLIEPRSGVLVGSCGLSPGFALDPNHPDDFHALVIWLHDYRSPQTVRNAAILSRGLCYGSRPAELEHWLRTQRIQGILPAEAGRSVTLEGVALRGRVTVLQVDTYPPNNPSGGIATITVRFDINQKGARPVVERLRPSRQ